MRQDTFIDKKALELHRQRVECDTFSDLFIFNLASNEIKQRLLDINHQFTKMAIVTGCPNYWNSVFPNAEIYSDEDEIDFQKRDYDLVIHAISLHWLSDPIGQLIQCRLALKADGLLIAVVFGGETLTELRHSLLQAETEISRGASPRVAPMAGVRDYGSLLQRAGFALPVVDRVKSIVTYKSCKKLMHDLRAMAETNCLASRRLNFTCRRLFECTEEIYRDLFSDNDGKLMATFELLFLTGWVPSKNQPQPLRPGSAANRLADALQTVEHKMKS